jgi:hypothetical protein
MKQEGKEFETAIEALADVFEVDKMSRQSFKDVLALTIQDELDKHLTEEGVAEMTGAEIVAKASIIAEDFVKTIENQND